MRTRQNILLLAILIALAPVVVGIYSRTATSPVMAAQAAADAQPATPAHPKYLLFYLSGATPEVPLGNPARVDTRAQIERAVDGVVRSIGQVGDHRHTQLGFSVGPLMFDLTDEQMRTLISESFAVAEEKNVAVAFHIDDFDVLESAPGSLGEQEQY